jgi:DNA ligase-1
MSEKLDGMRCFWTGKEGFSRNKNKVQIPEFFCENWPNAQLDGELWLDRDKFQETMRIVKKQKNTDEEEYRKICYMVYDAPGIDKPF